MQDPTVKPEPDSRPVPARNGGSRWLQWLGNDEELRRWLKGLILIGFTIFFVLFFGYMAFNILIAPESWILNEIKANFPGTIGIAFAAVSALFIVLLLQYTIGYIKLKAFKLEFEGAAAPTILWMFCFLAIVSGMRMLWQS